MTESPFPGSAATHVRRFDLFGSMRRAIVASLAGIVGWVSFVLLYVAFWSHGFSLFQSIVVIVVAFLVFTAFVAGAWISFGLRFAHRWPD